jgi:hypothetical protein
MAVKEQRRGNREAKKPKKDKSASATTPAALAPWPTPARRDGDDRKRK